MIECNTNFTINLTASDISYFFLEVELAGFNLDLSLKTLRLFYNGYKIVLNRAILHHYRKKVQEKFNLPHQSKINFSDTVYYLFNYEPADFFLKLFKISPKYSSYGNISVYDYILQQNPSVPI